MTLKKRILRDLVVLAAIFFGVTFWQTRNLVGTGEAAPAIVAPRTDGAAFDLTALKGKPVLLYFFAPWCSVCRFSASNAQWVRRALGSRIEVTAVALDYESEASIGEFIKAAGIEELPVVKGDDRIRDAYKVSAYPTYYLLDDQGRIKSKGVGYSTLLGLFLRALLA